VQKRGTTGRTKGTWGKKRKLRPGRRTTMRMEWEVLINKKPVYQDMRTQALEKVTYPKRESGSKKKGGGEKGLQKKGDIWGWVGNQLRQGVGHSRTQRKNRKSPRSCKREKKGGAADEGILVTKGATTAFQTPGKKNE